jgi:VIT1/CCC1 family predicted Fe2+/Mn2+ transporter
VSEAGPTPDDLRTKDQLPELQRARRGLRRTRPGRLLPHPGPIDGEQATSTGKTGTLRAAIFGVNDGLVSNSALIMGFAGAGQSRSVILLAGISGLLAGAFSMAAGEYISMRIQREVLERMLHLEAHELGAADPSAEIDELTEIYVRKGLSPDLARQVSVEVMKDPRVALETHAREELGIDPDEGLGSPVGAATSSFATFAIGAFVPLAPFLFVGGTAGTAISAMLTCIALLTVGALTSRLTGRSPWISSLRMLAIGGGAALVTYLIGSLIGVSVVG